MSNGGSWRSSTTSHVAEIDPCADSRACSDPRPCPRPSGYARARSASRRLAPDAAACSRTAHARAVAPRARMANVESPLDVDGVDRVHLAGNLQRHGGLGRSVSAWKVGLAQRRLNSRCRNWNWPPLSCSGFIEHIREMPRPRPGTTSTASSPTSRSRYDGRRCSQWSAAPRDPAALPGCQRRLRVRHLPSALDFDERQPPAAPRRTAMMSISPKGVRWRRARMR